MSTFVAKDGTQIYFKDWGSGKPVLFSHGWPLDADMWEYQMEYLSSRGFRTIAFDRRGFGRSDQPWTGNDYNTFADDIAQLIEHLDLKDVTLVGFSMGGGDVSRYIARHGSARVAGLVLLGAVKIAHAMGAYVVLFTTSPNKREDGLRLGADEVVVSKNADEMAKVANSLDFILNTVAASHNLDAFLNLLKRDGTMTLVGAPDSPHPSPTVFNLIFKRRSLAGSLIGGIQETQDMLDFCARHGIVSDIEMIDIQGINDAYERMLKGDVKYRFVIDIESLKKEKHAA